MISRISPRLSLPSGVPSERGHACLQGRGRIRSKGKSSTKEMLKAKAKRSISALWSRSSISNQLHCHSGGLLGIHSTAIRLIAFPKGLEPTRCTQVVPCEFPAICRAKLILEPAQELLHESIAFIHLLLWRVSTCCQTQAHDGAADGPALAIGPRHARTEAGCDRWNPLSADFKNFC